VEGEYTKSEPLRTSDFFSDEKKGKTIIRLVQTKKTLFGAERVERN